MALSSEADAAQVGWPGRVADLVSLALMAVVACVMLVTLPDYGITFDEEPHLRLGDRVLHFYQSGFEASRALRRTAYGAGFDVLSALLRRVSPFGPFDTNHIVCVFVAQLGLLGTWKLGRALAGPVAGAFALALLVLTPVYYGHQFNNPKDIPFAAGYVWGLYFIARLSRALTLAPDAAPGWRCWAALAVALALGMSVRLGGAILIGYLLFVLVGHALDALRLKDARAARGLWSALGRALLATASGWALMIPFWPRAFQDPIKAPVAAIETVTRFTAYDSPTLLRGRSVSSHHVPWDYLPTYLAGQLPELISLAFLAFIAVLALSTWRRLRQREPLVWTAWLVVIAVVLPPAYAIVRGSTLYNGMRHFLFIVPPICVLAAAQLAWLLERAWRARRALGALSAGLLLAFAIDQSLATVRLHPHQHVYFNRAFGGVQSAVGRYETEYYGSVYQELLGKLREHVWRERRESYFERPFIVTGCGSKLFFTQNLPLNFQYASMRRYRSADYYATYVRDGCLTRLRKRPPVARVAREGAILGIARELRRRR